MRYHWLREKQAKKHFEIFWDKSENNDADYYKKHHPTKYHKDMRLRKPHVHDKSQ